MTLADQPRVDQDLLRQARIDLAAALRAAALYGYNEGIDNHFSYAVPGSDNLFLLNPYGPEWSELTASDLLVVDGDGTVVEGEGEWETTAFMIHRGAHRARASACSTPTCRLRPRSRPPGTGSTRRSARPR
jgi:ribulose-5-phosphate 4-epimerase/fuculose-1-phosphate aldolase